MKCGCGVELTEDNIGYMSVGLIMCKKCSEEMVQLSRKQKPMSERLKE